MRFKLLCVIGIMTTSALSSAFAQDHVSARTVKDVPIRPTGTYKYVSRADGDLFLDYYAPAANSDTKHNGKVKPTILFVFGGGFCRGVRDGVEYLDYFKSMTKLGYPVVSIDYRLGMKDATHGGGIGSLKPMMHSIDIAVEDLFAATDFLLVNGHSIGVDGNNIVLCGSSAGSITVAHACWEIDKKSELAKILPENYKYKGVMIYSGGILSDKGCPKITSDFCPTLIMHGTADKTVKYKQIWFFNIQFKGGSPLTSLLDKVNVPHLTYRYKGNRHEICEIQNRTDDIQDFFIQYVIMDENKITVDATIVDPTIKKWAPKPTSELYKKK